MTYRTERIIDGKPRYIVVDENGKIINRNPNKEALKGLSKFYEKHGNSKLRYTKEQLINELRLYEKKYGSPPTEIDFTNNPEYPGFATYQRYFGSWANALKEAGYKVMHTGLRLKYNIGDICYICEKQKIITDKSILKPGNACAEKDREGRETGKVICWGHRSRDYQRYDSNSSCNIIKSMRDRRTGNLNDPRSIFADNCQELTCIWRGVKDLNKENDNYKSPIDHSRDSELGIIDTMGRRLYNSMLWSFGNPYRYSNKGIDNIICYCTSKDGCVIERIYIIPKVEIKNRKDISIVKNPTDSWRNPIISWYDNYRVKDIEILKKVNETWKQILEKKNIKKMF